MFRIFFIIFCLVAFSSKTATLDSLEQINADLLAKKSKAEPFKDKDVKVDVESLGLDEIDAKDGKTVVVKKDAPPAPTLPEPVLVKSEVVKSKLISPDNSPKQVGSAVSKFGSNAVSKIENFLQKAKPDSLYSKDGEEKSPNKTKSEQLGAEQVKPAAIVTPAIEKVDPKKEAQTNAEKKLNSKKQKAAKKKAEENEKKRKEKLEKLNKLREKYLIKVGTDKSDSKKNIDEDLADSGEKIIPQRKNINKFVSYEAPAQPILDRYRSRDNEGIPIVLSDREKSDNLFRSISQEDISYFNSAYSEIENPDLRNYAGDTILTYSLLLQKREAVASILAKGANPNLPNGLGYTPIQITIETLDLSSFNLLIKNNADVNYVDGFGRTHLMQAARVGFLPAIDILIKNGADVNAMDFDGFTALAIASRYKQDLAVTLLLKNGAKPWVEKPYDPESESIIKQLENKWKKN